MRFKFAFGMYVWWGGGQDYNTGSHVFFHEKLPMCFFHQKVYVDILCRFEMLANTDYHCLD